jgi:hypothetical protein
VGPVGNVRIAWADIIITTSPETIKRVLSTDFNNFVKGGGRLILSSKYLAYSAPVGTRLHNTMFSVLGNGVFIADGEHQNISLI